MTVTIKARFRVSHITGPNYPNDPRVELRLASSWHDARDQVGEFLKAWRTEGGSALGWHGLAECVGKDRARRELRKDISGRRETVGWIVVEAV